MNKNIAKVTKIRRNKKSDLAITGRSGRGLKIDMSYYFFFFRKMLSDSQRQRIISSFLLSTGAAGLASRRAALLNFGAFAGAAAGASSPATS